MRMIRRRSRSRAGRTALASALIVAGVVSLALFAGSEAGSGPAHNTENLLRLHVIAHSDEPREQRAKLLVRDALLAAMEAWPAPAGTAELEALFRKNAEELVRVARETLAAEGLAHDVRIEIGDYPYDERRTGDLVLPAGTYRSVRVVIGAGAGRNWWCVLFPPLCFVDDGAELTPGRAARPGATEDASTEELSLKEPSFEERPAANPPGGALNRLVFGREEAQPPVSWRLRLWERVSQGASVRVLRELALVSLDPSRAAGPGPAARAE